MSTFLIATMGQGVCPPSDFQPAGDSVTTVAEAIARSAGAVAVILTKKPTGKITRIDDE